MKIGAKLMIALVLPLIALVLVMGFLFQKRSQVLLREELVKEGRAIALVVQIAAEDYLRDRQLTDLQQLVEGITGYERVLGLRLFDASGAIRYQSRALTPYPFRHVKVLQKVIADRQPRETRRLIGGQPVVGFIVPLSNASGELIGAVQVLQLESYMREDDRATYRFILALCLAMAAAIVIIVFAITKFSISRPAAELVWRMREVGARDTLARVPVRGRDEFAMVSHEFNGMCARLEAAHQSLASEQERRRDAEVRLRNAERLAGLGRLAAGLAHEIGTPLNVISGRAESLQRSTRGDASTERSLQIIRTQIDRIVRIVRDMLDFARMKPPRRIPITLRETLQSVLDLIEDQMKSRGIAVETVLGGSLPALHADPDQLQQVFLNLAVNAMDAMPEGGRLRIQGGVEDRVDPERGGEPRACMVVRFEDTGTGIRQEHRHHVFDPFFTTKETGRGTGLGLSVSYGIIEEHSGWFDLESREGGGTHVTVILPLQADREATVLS